MIKKNEEMTKKIEAIFRAGRHPIQDTGFRKIFDAENEEGKKKLWKAIDKAMVKVTEEEHSAV